MGWLKFKPACRKRAEMHLPRAHHICSRCQFALLAYACVPLVCALHQGAFAGWSRALALAKRACWRRGLRI